MKCEASFYYYKNKEMEFGRKPNPEESRGNTLIYPDDEHDFDKNQPYSWSQNSDEVVDCGIGPIASSLSFENQ